MEFCITLLLKSFQPGPEFTLPERFQMALGVAYREEDVGKYFWPGGLNVRDTPTCSFLLKYLPPEFHSADWQFLALDGSGLADFEDWVNQDAPDEWETTSPIEHPLILLVQHLLHNQPQWAAFVQRDCEDMAVSLCQSVSEFCDSLVNAYRWEGNYPECGGFCSYSKV